MNFKHKTPTRAGSRSRADLGNAKMDNLLSKIRATRSAGELETALALALAWLSEHPQDVNVLKELALIQSKREDWGSVVAALERVQAIEPLGPHTTELAANAHRQLVSQAIKTARHADASAMALALAQAWLSEHPQDIGMLKELALIQRTNADWGGVIAALERVRAIEPLGPQTAALYALAVKRLAKVNKSKPDESNINTTVAPLTQRPDAANVSRTAYYIDPQAPARLPIDVMVATLAAYDVISFDIFDTAIVRAVAKPNDVFRIMGRLIGVTDFVRKRKDAEAYARTWKDRTKGTREITLHEIYDVLNSRSAGSSKWEALEQELEIKLTRANPYIFEVYERLRALGKTLIFTSDMYLSRKTISAMLARAGYCGYDRIYLSNERGARKGDGTLQKIVRADYEPKGSIVHVGDVYDADVTKSIAAGMAAVYNPNQHGLVREKDMSNLAGSFYEAVIDNRLGTGMWAENLYYTHGFRTGGILALGYIEFLDRLAKEKGIDKILFLGRDCDILSRIYTRFFATVPSAYVGTSRAASLMLTADTNFDDFINRTFFRWYRDSNNTRPIFQILQETGFGYLIDELESYDIERFQFPASADESRLHDFLWSQKDTILAHTAESRAAARDYFQAAIGDAKNVLIVDIGWTGTCITALRDFFRSSFGEHAPKVFGALLGTSRNEQINDAVSDGTISAFIYSPVMNQDITRLIMPAGKIPQRQKDLLTLPIEYLFTEPVATTASYAKDGTGNTVLVRGTNVPPNADQIREMQRGMMDFVSLYLDYSSDLADLRRINSYIAFQPLRNSLGKRDYLYSVYKDFMYDAAPVLHGGASVFDRFGTLFNTKDKVAAVQRIPGTDIAPSTDEVAVRPKIIFISPEMKYVGAPKSLLRLCKVAEDLGYEPIVWTAQHGAFEREFEVNGFPVSVVTTDSLTPDAIDALKRDNVRLVVCNTVVTDGYVRVFEGKLPVAWYVREATNIPQFLRGNPMRAATLQRSSSLVVVSDYAAMALAHYATGKIDVVRNAVEDVSELAPPYMPRENGITRFAQLGTIEHRKGYDLFVAAYKAMPPEYRARAELHFAGGFINSATAFASYLFGQIENEPNIHYHGLISDERQKIALLSEMDAVVVASRDESCSLVALEGAMLSKPLIVTENVGAKYMVDEQNGVVIPSGDVASLRDAFMQVIDFDAKHLAEAGVVSRHRYDELASMANHSRELGALFERRIAAGPVAPLPELPEAKPASDTGHQLIVSLTSYPPRMPVISRCIASLKRQSKRPDRIILWLSKDQFPHREMDLPEELLAQVDGLFEIRWVSGDIGPHKKYFYAIQAYPDALVVTVDDDVNYDPKLIETLYQEHLVRPHAIIAGRCNLIRFRPNGSLRTYDQWGYEHRFLRETETFALLPTGIGGVLYPPKALPAAAFDMDAIMTYAPHADDLWLKVMATANGTPVWMPHRLFGYRNIDGSQSSALWRVNAFDNGNDQAIQSILRFIEQKYKIAESVLHRIQGVRPDGTYIGPGDILDCTSLLSTNKIQNSNRSK